MKFLTILLFTVIGFGAKATNSHKHHGHQEKKSDVSLKTVSKEAKAELKSVLEKYDELHSVFFQYNGKEVEKVATKLKAEINKIQDSDFKKLLSFSAKKLDSLKASSSREENNKNFNIISMALIHVINKYDVSSDHSAFYCPMVKKKWIQNTKKLASVSNPYAPEMPGCGGKM